MHAKRGVSTIVARTPPKWLLYEKALAKVTALVKAVRAGSVKSEDAYSSLTRYATHHHHHQHLMSTGGTGRNGLAGPESSLLEHGCSMFMALHALLAEEVAGKNSAYLIPLFAQNGGTGTD